MAKKKLAPEWEQEYVRQKLKEHGYKPSGIDLANVLGYSRSVAYNFIQGKCSIPQDRINKLYKKGVVPKPNKEEDLRKEAEEKLVKDEDNTLIENKENEFIKNEISEEDEECEEMEEQEDEECEEMDEQEDEECEEMNEQEDEDDKRDEDMEQKESFRKELYRLKDVFFKIAFYIPRIKRLPCTVHARGFKIRIEREE